MSYLSRGLSVFVSHPIWSFIGVVLAVLGLWLTIHLSGNDDDGNSEPDTFEARLILRWVGHSETEPIFTFSAQSGDFSIHSLSLKVPDSLFSKWRPMSITELTGTFHFGSIESRLKKIVAENKRPIPENGKTVKLPMIIAARYFHKGRKCSTYAAYNIDTKITPGASPDAPPVITLRGIKYEDTIETKDSDEAVQKLEQSWEKNAPDLLRSPSD